MSARLALDVLLFAGLVLFGVGAYWRDRRCHLARAAAWALFGAFWFAQVPAFLNSGDPVNSLGAAVALPVFLFLAYHETLSYKWDEEYQPLRFLAVGAFWAAGIYFVVDRVPAISGGLIDLVANHTVVLRNVVVIYFYNEAGDAWEFVHNAYGKGLSFLVLIVLMLVAFWLLPELYLNINGLFELPWRKRPGHDYRRFVGRLSKKKPPTPPAGGTGSTRSNSAGSRRTPPSSP